MNIDSTRARTWLLTAYLALATTAGWAGAPQGKGQAPGWYRMMLGDFEITALSDGTAALPVDKLLTNTSPAKVQAALARAYLKSPLETSVNGYLINTGSKLVLIIRTDKREGDFWLSKENLDQAPEAMKGFFQGAQASMKPYVDAGKYKPFDRWLPANYSANK